jgi:ABC-type multidrug transport system fused ATPase/permease subunit
LLKTLQKIIHLLSDEDRKKGIWVLALFFGMSLLEVVGVASIMPFLALLGDPGLMESSYLLNVSYNLASSIGIQGIDDFFIFLGILSFFIISLGSCYKLYALYKMNSFIEMQRHRISSRLLSSYLKQPYSFFLNRHSGELSKSILSEVDLFVASVLRPVFGMIVNLFVLVTIITLVVSVNPYIAAAAGLVLGTLYALYFLFVKNKVGELGNELSDANKIRFTKASDLFGAIKIIKLLRCEINFLKEYKSSSEQFSSSLASHNTIGTSPKFIVEAFAFGSALVIVLGLIISSGGLADSRLGEVLPIIGLYVLAAYKIQPALQYIFHGVTSLKYGKKITDNLLNDIFETNALPHRSLDQKANKLRFSSCLSVNDVSYTYPNAQKTSLSSINIKIGAGQSVGIVGTTGAGKTTLVDIILGLLSPSKGTIAVDGVVLDESNRSNWQSMLGYVPQEIILNDTTISENIALGVSVDCIDQKLVEKCAAQAQIHEFISNELPSGYATKVGERGVRLSGGQRQRIGIARALYRNPAVIIFDEATSALDTLTEKQILNSVNDLSKHKTILIITHRLSTVKGCDQILLLEHGSIKDCGNYDELVSRNKDFQLMVGEK